MINLTATIFSTFSKHYYDTDIQKNDKVTKQNCPGLLLSTLSLKSHQKKSILKKAKMLHPSNTKLLLPTQKDTVEHTVQKYSDFIKNNLKQYASLL